MAAPNQQPHGSRPGPKPAIVHPPIDTFKSANGPTGVADHGTPKPTGGGKKNPLH